MLIKREGASVIELLIWDAWVVAMVVGFVGVYLMALYFFIK